jgi:deoxyribose-phosphate aldolase
MNRLDGPIELRIGKGCLKVHSVNVTPTSSAKPSPTALLKVAHHYHEMVETAVRALQGSGIPVAAVSTGFPAGLNPFGPRLEEIRASAQAGASEIDIVITRAHVLTGNWQALYDEVAAFREACGEAHLKAILATGELGTLRNGEVDAADGLEEPGRLVVLLDAAPRA